MVQLEEWQVEHQIVNDCMKDADKPQRIKTREEVLQERAAIEAFQRISESERIATGGKAIAMGLFTMMLTAPEALKQRTDRL